MEKLYSVAEICARYGVKPRKAREIMRGEMLHMEKPALLVPERAVIEYERRNTLFPEKQTRKGARRN